MEEDLFSGIRAHVTTELDFRCVHCGLTARPSVIGESRVLAEAQTTSHLGRTPRQRAALLAEKDAKLSTRLARCPRCRKRSSSALLALILIAGGSGASVAGFFLSLGLMWSSANGVPSTENMGGFGIVAAMTGPLAFAWVMRRSLVRSERNVVF